MITLWLKKLTSRVLFLRKYRQLQNIIYSKKDIWKIKEKGDIINAIIFKIGRYVFLKIYNGYLIKKLIVLDQKFHIIYSSRFEKKEFREST